MGDAAHLPTPLIGAATIRKANAVQPVTALLVNILFRQESLKWKSSQHSNNWALDLFLSARLAKAF